MIEHPDKLIRAEQARRDAEFKKLEIEAIVAAHEANIDRLLKPFLAATARKPVEYAVPRFGQDDALSDLARRYQEAGWTVATKHTISLNPADSRTDAGFLVFY